jgi:hypothetical protein
MANNTRTNGKSPRTVTPTTGRILWAQKTVVASKQYAWHDSTIYRVPVVGTIDIGKIRNALYARVNNGVYNYFGGGQTLGTVVDNGDGTINVETCYSIGN